MSDLISRSESYMNDLIRREDVLALFPMNDCSDKMIGLYERVLDIPTAFNTEAAIKQMQEYAECKEECKNNFYYGQGCKACAWNGMIEIVKAGGIDG